MSSQVNDPPGLGHLQVLAFWNPAQGWNDPAPDDLGARIVAGSFRFEAGRDLVDGDVPDLPRSSLTFRLRNADGRFSPLNANSPLNQAPKALGVGRPLLVRAAIPDVPTMPDVPAAPSVWPSDGRLHVDWDAPDLHGHTLTGYELRYREAGAADWIIHVNKQASRTRVVPPASVTTPLTNGRTYEAQIRTVGDAGTGDWSESGTGVPRTAATVRPGFPTVTAIQAGPGSIHAAWKHPGTGQPVTRYRLQYHTAADPWTEHSMPGRSLATTVTGLRGNVTYRFRLRAVNNIGAGGWQHFTSTPNAAMAAPPSAGSVHSTVSCSGSSYRVTVGASGSTGIGTAFVVTVNSCHGPSPWALTARMRKR